METILSTPGILAEYGNPHVGDFYIAEPADGPPGGNPLVAVEIAGGVLQAAYASDPAIRLVLLDYDTEGCDPAEDANLFEITDPRGGRQVVYATDYPIMPLAGLAGTDAAKALDKAGIDYRQPTGPETETIRRWVLYHLATDQLLTGHVYGTYEEAVEDASQVADVLVLPLVWQGVSM